MFAVNAFQVNAFQIGSTQGVIPPVIDDIGGNKGGWDPYYYKKRNKRRDKKRDVVQFIEEVAAPELVTAPQVIQDQARQALEAARLAIRLEQAESLARALREINEFYALVRAEAKRIRDDDEEDDDLLLLSS